MLTNGLVHFMATDAHGPKSRRPLMNRCYHRVRELAGAATAEAICRVHPAAVADGQHFQLPRPARRTKSRAGLNRRRGWFDFRKSA
jgi:tyrosine-protein phosphatase YwqE